jgi:hypothetical protein
MATPPTRDIGLRAVSKYRHNHIVTRGYLNLFARHGQIVAYLTATGQRKVIGTNHAAVRTAFYVEERDDGTRSAWLEQQIGQLEAPAVALMRDIEARWPLNDDDRGVLCAYLGLQAVRGPAWRKRYERLVTKNLPEYGSGAKRISKQAYAEFERRVQTDNHRHSILVSQVAKLGTVFGSMHLTLLRFGSPRLVTSDHPLVAVPVTPDGVCRPEPVPSQGYMNMLEFRFPVTARHALILSWVDGPDHERIRAGGRAQAANLNYSVRSQADKQWFHTPGHNPPHRAADYGLLSAELYPGYSAHVATGSERRQLALAAIDDMIENDDNTHVRILKAEPRGVQPHSVASG